MQHSGLCGTENAVGCSLSWFCCAFAFLGGARCLSIPPCNTQITRQTPGTAKEGKHHAVYPTTQHTRDQPQTITSGPPTHIATPPNNQATSDCINCDLLQIEIRK